MNVKNLILIIGNGFDLAHGLKTSYNHFADYIIENIIAPEFYKDYSNNNLTNNNLIRQINHRFKYPYLASDRIDRIDNKFVIKIDQRRENIAKVLKENKNKIKDIINNKFLGKLYANEYQNWFDIENAYFEELILIKEKEVGDYTDYTKEQRIKDINELNDNLTEIKELLKEYLKTIKINANKDIDCFLRNNFFNKYDNIYIIDFNYTKTIEKYFDENPLVTINYIHGNLDDENIIFGYGNNKHPKYKELKETGINEYLRFFKTFEYFENGRYINIIRTVEKFNHYDVGILGHSLGQPDKALLKNILDNKRCETIHFYKRGDLENLKEIKENFYELLFSLSRISEDENEMLKKVINYENSISFPSTIN